MLDEEAQIHTVSRAEQSEGAAAEPGRVQGARRNTMCCALLFCMNKICSHEKCSRSRLFSGASERLHLFARSSFFSPRFFQVRLIINDAAFSF